MRYTGLRFLTNKIKIKGKWSKTATKSSRISMKQKVSHGSSPVVLQVLRLQKKSFKYERCQEIFKPVLSNLQDNELQPTKRWPGKLLQKDKAFSIFKCGLKVKTKVGQRMKCSDKAEVTQLKKNESHLKLP